MSGVNKVIFVGKLGQNPEISQTSSGQNVCNFSLALNEAWRDKSGERHERTEWVKIVAWGKLAETCASFLRKGSTAYVEGKLRTREYEDKQGSKKFSTEFHADQVRFLGGMPEAKERVQNDLEIARQVDNAFGDPTLPF